MIVSVAGHASGMPVIVEAVSFDGEEYSCPGCRRRFTTANLLVAHAMSEHRDLVKGGNP